MIAVFHRFHHRIYRTTNVRLNQKKPGYRPQPFSDKQQKWTPHAVIDRKDSSSQYELLHTDERLVLVILVSVYKASRLHMSLKRKIGISLVVAFGIFVVIRTVFLLQSYPRISGPQWFDYTFMSILPESLPTILASGLI